ncbi:MAG: SAM-dependent methyltransferase [Planctomycetaceae bacterium]|nr:SAM-dependent methyltransferase [Planctomycetaceae bacterium]|tara:strand:+ start:297 stop:1100 length:804 start_codon:yes stop_codon:yes gene_type:complete
MAKYKNKPLWQLPKGVSQGLWDYSQSAFIAEDYDEYFSHTSLFDLDQEIVLETLERVGQAGDLIADLGCGTGRALEPVVQAGYQGLAIDLSWPMLRVVQQKADKQNLNIQCLRANLVELEILADNSIDHCLCLFSTLGMISGAVNRESCLGHISRILKPGGRFILHIHNYWYNLYDPGGPKWLIGNWFKSMFSSKLERGDRHFSYRGVPNMFLHVFRYREIKKCLLRAGLVIEKTVPLYAQPQKSLLKQWLLRDLRASGWIFVTRHQ